MILTCFFQFSDMTESNWASAECYPVLLSSPWLWWDRKAAKIHFFEHKTNIYMWHELKSPDFTFQKPKHRCNKPKIKKNLCRNLLVPFQAAGRQRCKSFTHSSRSELARVVYWARWCFSIRLVELSQEQDCQRLHSQSRGFIFPASPCLCDDISTVDQ